MGSVASCPFFGFACCQTIRSSFAGTPLVAEEKVVPHSVLALLPARNYSGQETWLLN